MQENEIEFMKYFAEVMLPNRNAVTGVMVAHAGNLIGKTVNVNCPTCLHGSAIDLKNLYFRMLPAYETYLKILEKPIEATVEVKKQVKKNGNTTISTNKLN